MTKIQFRFTRKTSQGSENPKASTFYTNIGHLKNVSGSERLLVTDTRQVILHFHCKSRFSVSQKDSRVIM